MLTQQRRDRWLVVGAVIGGTLAGLLLCACLVYVVMGIRRVALEIQTADDGATICAPGPTGQP